MAFVLPLEETTRAVDWDQARSFGLMPEDLLKAAPVVANYLPLPPGAMQLKLFKGWAKHLDRWLARTQRADLSFKTDESEAVSLPPRRGGVSVELVAILWELE